MHAEAQKWIDRDPDPETRAELEALVANNDEQEINRRFCARLSFGTAGLRGLLGAGPRRMNRLVVQETTAGLANYILKNINGCLEKGVVIAYDGRHKSERFAQDAACILTAFGLKVLLGTEPFPTPLCPFAMRYFGAAAGIVVTASHNPKNYNGYKVYWENTAQIIPPHDQGIAEAINKIAGTNLPRLTISEAREMGLLHPFGPLVVDAYLREVLKLTAHPETRGISPLKLAYSPLHGVGGKIALSAIKHAGFNNTWPVESQIEIDPNFPTVDFPNPEEPGALDELLKLAAEKEVDLALANDPDADRLAVAARDASGNYRILNGNEIGVLLGADLIKTYPKSAIVGSTIVSSRLLSRIAKAHGIDYFDTLTGFKWIANRAIAEEHKGKNFLMGYEEAIGYTIGNLVRDKDGISALVAFCLHAARLYNQGQTILGLLESIYQEYGYHYTQQISLTFDEGSDLSGIGEKLRKNLPQTMADLAVVRIHDYQTQQVLSPQGAKLEAIDLPKSDVLAFDLEEQTRIIVRPSGTEPKLKLYYELTETFAKDDTWSDVEAKADKRFKLLSDKHVREIRALL